MLSITASGCALVGKGAGRGSACARIAELSRSGEHKPAVDAALELAETGKECPPDVQEAVALSRSKLQKADSYVHKALKRKGEGNLLSARANLERALQVYPRYYWVQTLMKNINSSIKAELDSLRSEASYFESRGSPEVALLRVLDAMKLSPGDEKLEAEAARLTELMKVSERELDVQAVLDQARVHLEEGRYEEARRLLTEKDTALLLGSRGEILLAEVLESRTRYIREMLDLAVEKEKSGDLDSAQEHLLLVLEISGPGDRTSAEVVKFARLFGMKLYSAGEFSRARELWARALMVDPENLKLQSYLREVETRLDNLDRIKKGGTADVER